MRGDGLAVWKRKSTRYSITSRGLGLHKQYFWDVEAKENYEEDEAKNKNMLCRVVVYHINAQNTQFYPLSPLSNLLAYCSLRNSLLSPVIPSFKEEVMGWIPNYKCISALQSQSHNQPWQ